MTADLTGVSEHTKGMPQLDFSTFPNQIFWLVVTLVILYLILSRVALPRIAGVLSDRQGAITGDIAMAEELKLKAEQAEVAYVKALADARGEAQRIIAETKADIARDFAAALAEADAEIAAKAGEAEKRIVGIHASAMENVAEVAKAAAGEIVAAFLDKPNKRAVAVAVSARLHG